MRGENETDEKKQHQDSKAQASHARMNYSGPNKWPQKRFWISFH